MPYEFSLRRMVEFAETDMAGIMHFSNYFRFMEATEHAFFRSLGATVHAHEPGRMAGWARVEAACSYLKPLHYQDEVDVHLLVREKRPKSIAYAFTFRTTEDVAHGSMTTVHVERTPDDEGMRSAEMPREVWDLIDVAPAELLP